MARALKYLLMPQRAHRVIVSSISDPPSRKTRELVVLRVAFVVPRAVDEVHNVADAVATDRESHRSLRSGQAVRHRRWDGHGSGFTADRLPRYLPSCSGQMRGLRRSSPLSLRPQALPSLG